MKFKIFSLFAILTLLMACEGSFDMESDRDGDVTDRGAETSDDEKADTLSQRAALTGQELYVQECGTCHGDDALGAQAWPVSIQGFFPVYGVISAGTGTMAPVIMTDDEIAKVQQFLLDMDM